MIARNLHFTRNVRVSLKSLYRSANRVCQAARIYVYANCEFETL